MVGDQAKDHSSKTSENTNNKFTESLGLTTRIALETLQRDIKRVLQEYEEDCRRNKKYKAWLKDTLHHRSQYTTLCWTSAIALLINAIILVIAFFTVNETWYLTLPYEGLTVCCLIVLNFILVVSDNKLRHKEIPHRVRILIDQLEVAKHSCQWVSENYPHLCSPLSPCLTLQWTYRDGHIVNLPWALLVAGDIIVMKPGQQAPGYCVPYEDTEAPVLHVREVYSPQVHSANEIFSTPQARAPLKNKIYKLQETPYLMNLRMALDQALDRPVTYHNRKRHLLMICCIEQLAYPILLIIVLIVNLFRYSYLSEYFGVGHWNEMFLLQPIAISIPLLPLVFPICWIFLNCFGMARFKALFKLYQSSKKLQFVDPFEDTDISGPSYPEVVYNWLELKEYFFNILFGKEHMMSRSASILHVLGSVTALCCVDKKGILSWPNPTAEKVFFLRNANTLSPSSSTGSLDKTSEHQCQTQTEDSKQYSNKTSYVQHDMSHSTAEVLDLTHDHALPFRLQFDDHAWRQHLNSLKPLGLAILLNTCNMQTQEHYMQFCCHVTCEALYNENLVPVTNRRYQDHSIEDKSGYQAKDTIQSSRQVYLVDESGSLGQMWCLCELAKQIGFQEQAQNIFQLEQQLSTFRHVQPEMVRRDIKFARSLSIATKLKFPFPHMVAVVVKERSGGGLQLLTQGTADIILDSCIEFWDGHDLCPLSASDRKKVQDFYQRTSLTSYCTAFAYRPLTRGISNKMSKIYLELPADSKHLYTPHRSPTPLPWDFRNVLDPRVKGILGQFHSTDSLLCNENKDDNISDVESCFEIQCNQVFIGMVTMQYQAQTDMVQLIEQLDRACIRFVHFSKENELRSRVFSEKMGLESGWNCHISLLSERARSESPVGWWVSQAAAMSSPTPSAQSHQHNYSCMDEASHLLNRVSPRTNLDTSRAMSMSAPSAINTDFSTVKFDDETTEWNDTGLSQVKSAMSHSLNHLVQRIARTGSSHFSEQDTVRSEDSVLVQSVDLGSGQEAWRSLSCLTDSTEQSAPVNFDLSNRAKLPRGIDKIRPHLELIDNVPLLVSLFTDCNTAVTREMLHIMQDYGEVVCVLGSSANAENMPIFMQADAGVAVEPLYPQVCQRVPVLTPTREEQGPSPVDISRALNSIACSLSVKREDPIAIFHLIMEARHYMKCLWNCVQFWLCCTVTLSFTQALSSFLLLPPLFSVDQVLWLSCLIIPMLSISMIATPKDPTIMQRATGKNQCTINGQIALFVLWCYGSKFVPTIITIVLSQCISFLTLCPIYTTTDSKCLYVYPESRGEVSWGGWGAKPNIILVVQHFALSLLVLHLVTISIGFVHREYSIWRKQPFNNFVWFLSAFIALCAQAAFSGTVFCTFWKEEGVKIEDFPVHLPLFFLMSLPLIFLINELIKWQEIKVNVRYQKRARLEFGTKLGMNSPF
nr:transmembrane protein 94 isoform X1 [Nomia melanderi]XP_031837360.1 transmembrane protein 94 isoform X1 [Nomia melanderi]XP_031837361.1 transmembrane protein 94 isoform X1 [Nomia melanderi]XP_031837362.1 transmembrane protein 94 isoform X1 [Nomia melanderi]XP_031837363.1 transmembrane protein 94 isoform X1 [Nomia melanderi]